MELSKAIKKVVDTNGIEILKDQQKLIGILSDYKAFEDMPNARYMLKQIYQNGYSEQIYNAYQNKDLTQINALKSTIAEKMGYDSHKLTQIFNGFNVALGIKTKEDNPKPPPYPSNNDSKKSFWLEIKKFFKKNRKLLLEILKISGIVIGVGLLVVGIGYGLKVIFDWICDNLCWIAVVVFGLLFLCYAGGDN